MAKADRKGKRKGRDNFRTRVPDLGYYFIVTDTRETEENYMYGLRDSLPKDLQGRIVIKVSKAKTDELVTACKEQAAMEPQYGEPWIVFDRDRVIHFDQIIENAEQEYKKSSSKIYTILNRYGDEIEAIKIAESRFMQYLRDGINKLSEMCPCTTVYKLVEKIYKKTGKIST